MARSLRALSIVATLVTVTGCPAGLAAGLDVARFETAFRSLEVHNDVLVAGPENGGRVRLTIHDRRLRQTPYELSASGPTPEDMLPDGQVTTGPGQIRRAWLADPTRRYDHGVLGDALEGSKLVVIDDAGDRHEHNLPPDQVFEDRYPRLADLDGDRRDEVLVIRSHLEKGAAVAVYAIRDGRLVEVGASEPIGRSHRWLNIVGVADFDGEGTAELAVVLTPHIGGVLTVLRWNGNALGRIYERPGFSNHEYGSRELGMSAILDIDGDGAQDMAVPDAERRSLVLLTLAGGVYRELARVANRAPIASGIHTVDLDGDQHPELAYLLADGMLVLVTTRAE